MDPSEEDRIAPLYKGRHILVSGGECFKAKFHVLNNIQWLAGTGFMGKVFIEKLLRYTEVDKIYMLMRIKKGKSPEERLQADIFSNPVSFLIL